MLDSTQNQLSRHAIILHLDNLERANSSRGHDGLEKSDMVASAIINLTIAGIYLDNREVLLEYHERIYDALGGALKLKSPVFFRQIDKYEVAIARQNIYELGRNQSEASSITSVQNPIEEVKEQSSEQLESAIKIINYVAGAASTTPMGGQVAQYQKAAEGIRIDELTQEEKNLVIIAINRALELEMQSIDVQDAGVLQRVLRPILDRLQISYVQEG